MWQQPQPRRWPGCAPRNTWLFSSIRHFWRPSRSRATWCSQHIGTAVPVHVNFAINGMDRVARELRAALTRHKRAVLLVRQEAQQAVRNELKDAITALLLSCEMALQVPNLQSGAESQMRTVHQLTQEIRAQARRAPTPFQRRFNSPDTRESPGSAIFCAPHAPPENPSRTSPFPHYNVAAARNARLRSV